MSKVLEFLERVGQDWQLRHADPAVLTQVMAQAGLDPSLQAAILDPDARRLETLLNLSGNVCCAVHPAHEDEEDLTEDEEDFAEDDDDFDADDFDDDDFDDDDEDEDEDLSDEEDDQRARLTRR